MKNLLLFISLILTSHLSYAQLIQQGLDIEGEAGEDLLGWSVSISNDGSVIAMGAPDNDENGANSGHVRVYAMQNGNWVQKGSDIDGEAAGDQFGYAVSVSSDGNTIAVGAPYNNGNGNDSGHVRIYTFQGEDWVQLGEDIDGEEAGEQSGWSISLSDDGNRIALGAPLNSGNGGSSGRVRVYELQGDTWEQLGGDIDGPAPGNFYGSSISLGNNGNSIAIGAQTNGDNGLQSGHVKVFRYDEDDMDWVQLGEDIQGDGVGSFLGKTVSFSTDGMRLAVGGGPDILGDGGGGLGYVRIYEFDGVEWIQVGADINGLVGERMAYSLSLSGDGTTVATGAPGNSNENGLGSGRVQLYRYIGDNWIQLGDDIQGESGFDQLGTSVALSADGETVIVSAPYNDGESGPDAGQAIIFVNNAVLSVDDENFAADLQLFPNPNTNVANITLPDTEQTETVDLILNDMQGRLIYQKRYQPTNTIVLDTGSLTKGLYLVTLVTEKGKKATLKMLIN